MVIDEKTLFPLHPLSKQGEKEYKRFLTFEADKLIYFSKHPLDKILYRISRYFGFDSIQNEIEEKIECGQI